ncbi:TPA: ribonuclease [Citrobacter koseri]|uniref:ribonuclease domain-containing protein n=1 Tax=Citrobacter koseri TaxID=545 RepID=UPI0024B68A75|nr:ribonuclease domain-containing protein [Citrobacter koseri]MDI9801323.1 ribonuclease domain-containing protein [Citrobacter koseri]HCR9728324.1 ribonuclease [Citrobacter koseri]HCR9746001.1 ribonuclease [Citrobacter koseri]HEM6684846.1 ribonuclease [Citrobacter koseri]
MKKILLAITLSLMPLGCYSIAAEVVTCESELKEFNAFFSNNGGPIIHNIADAVTVLRSLNSTNRLPVRYITSDEARRLGWSGHDLESLWRLKATYGKWIGGDAYRNPILPGEVPWFTADLDMQRGYRSDIRLIYSPATTQRYISPDKYQHIFEISPCR